MDPFGENWYIAIVLVKVLRETELIGYMEK